MLDTGCWMLCWQLAAGFRLLDAGFSTLATGLWKLVAGNRLLASDHWSLAAGIRSRPLTFAIG